MHLAISMNKTEVMDAVLNDFSEVKLDLELIIAFFSLSSF